MTALQSFFTRPRKSHSIRIQDFHANLRTTWAGSYFSLDANLLTHLRHIDIRASKCRHLKISATLSLNGSTLSFGPSVSANGARLDIAESGTLSLDLRPALVGGTRERAGKPLIFCSLLQSAFLYDAGYRQVHAFIHRRAWLPSMLTFGPLQSGIGLQETQDR